jgi:hypothetical protein
MARPVAHHIVLTMQQRIRPADDAQNFTALALGWFVKTRRNYYRCANVSERN